MYLMQGASLPENKDLPSDQFKDKILRELDCSVIQFMHDDFFKTVKTEEKEKDFHDCNCLILPVVLFLRDHLLLRIRYSRKNSYPGLCAQF